MPRVVLQPRRNQPINICHLSSHFLSFFWCRGFCCTYSSSFFNSLHLHFMILFHPLILVDFLRYTLRTEKYFRNLIKSNWNQIVFTSLWLIWNQTDFRLYPNQSENGKYNLISVWFNKNSKRFLCSQAAYDVSLSLVGLSLRLFVGLSSARDRPTIVANLRYLFAWLNLFRLVCSIFLSVGVGDIWLIFRR